MSRRTIARAVDCQGRGLHSGRPVRLWLEPGAAGGGVLFERVDLPGARCIAARLDAVAATERRTALRAGAQRVDTVEHLLAAVYAAGLSDLLIRLDGPEVPILDGSFAPFAELLAAAGAVEQPGRQREARLTERMEVEAGGGHYRLEPAEELEIEVELAYAEPVIGRQRACWDGSPSGFRQEIAPARTYGFLQEVESLRARGLLQGAGGDCAVVLSPTTVLNTELRWPDEFARHKLGDLVGDLALVGARLRARIVAERPSHRGNLACARALAQAARFAEV